MGSFKIQNLRLTSFFLTIFFISHVYCGPNKIYNADFSARIKGETIYSLSYWMIVDAIGDEQQSSRQNWVFAPAVSGYSKFLSVKGQYIVQTTPSLEAGTYRISVLLYLKQGFDPSQYQGFTILAKFISIQKDPVQQTYKLQSSGSEIVSLEFTITEPTQVLISLSHQQFKDNVYYFTNIYLQEESQGYSVKSLKQPFFESQTIPVDPSPKPVFIQNCKQVKRIRNFPFCISCRQGFVFSQKNTCIMKVDFCYEYKETHCITCIKGYFLSQNICIRQSSECQKTDPTGSCTQCQDGFFVFEGICKKKSQQMNKFVCSPSQYLSKTGKCLQGKIQKCIRYTPYSGQCQKCEEGYKINSQNLCVRKCPPDSEFTKYFLMKGECIATDINCVSINDDRSCGACQNNFFLRNGQCIYLKNIQKKSSFSQQNSDKIIIDNQMGSYIFRSDSSRIYLTGPWKNLQVWSDNSEDLYLKTSNGGRKYLTGQFNGSTAFKESSGKWYILTSEGKRRTIEQN